MRAARPHPPSLDRSKRASLGWYRYYQNYERRAVLLEGKVAFNETMSLGQFWKKYYAHAATEDLPGDDSWGRYVAPRFKFVKMETAVTDGALDIAFDCPSTYACTLSSALVFPAAKAAQAQAFFDELQAQMKADYDIDYAQLVPPPAPPPAEVVVVFQRGIEDDIGAYDGPRAGEVVVGGALAPVRLSVGDGLVTPVSFAVKGGAAAPAAVSAVEVSGLGAGVTAAVLLVRYKQRRLTADGSVFGMEPLLLDPFPPGGASLGAGVVRRLWIELSATAAAAPAASATITLHFASAPPIVLSLPILSTAAALPPTSLWLGYLGFTPTYPGTVWPSAAGKQRNETLPSAQLLRRYGQTALTGGLGGPAFKGYSANGSADVDFAAWDASLGVAHAIFPGVTLNTYGGGDVSGAPDGAALTATIKATAARAAARGWPLIYENIADEPSGDAVAADDALAAAVVAAGAPTRYSPSAFTSFTSSAQPHAELTNHSSLIILNEHSADAIAYVRSKKKQWMLYNAGSRFKRGFYLFRLRPLGCLGHYQFAFSSVHADPYYALDSREDDLCAARTTPTGELLPELSLARLALGTRDLRFCLALEALVAAAPPSPARARGEALLAEIGQIPVGSTPTPFWSEAKVANMSDSVFDTVAALR